MIWLRSALFQASFHAATVLLLIPGMFVLAFAPSSALGLARAWAEVTLGLLRVICGVRFAARGLEHLPDGACLIASRHESAFDTFVWLILRPRCAYVVKAELGRIPLIGALIRRAGMIVVEREAGAQALRGLLRDGAAAAAAGRPIVIFPEGTRMAPGVAGAVQPGVAALAAALALPVVAVATDSGAFWGRRAFRIAPGTIRIDVRPPSAPGLGRRALLSAIASGIRPDPVDKSVG